MLVLHTFIGSLKDVTEESGTWGWFKKHEREFPDWQFIHAPILKGSPYAYSDLLSAWWGRGDLLTWERDNLPAHIADLRALESCPEPWCALDYELVRCKMIDVQNVRTISGKFLISALVCAEHQKSHSMMRDWEGRTNPGDWTHCPNPPLGLTRFRKEAMPEGPPLWPRTRWEVLDTEVAKTVGKSGLSCHIHGPKAIHYHRFRPEEHVHPAFAERHEPIIRLSQVSPEHRKRIEALL